ncbi:hypothetical protein PHISP_01561 [Aspergillus sp. HF37]|nr:hypothetical protein PHISP_01561 [Aspergillus sp. HF37]
MPKSGIHYRYAQLEDSTEIASLGAHVFTVSFAHLVPAEGLQTYLAESYSATSIAAELARPSTTFVVAVEHGAIVGFMQLTQDASEACIDHVDSKIQLQRLYISEKRQGLGIGKELMARAETEARRSGIANIWLASWESNHAAERVYEKAGFVKVGRMAFMLGNAELRDWVMIKAL